MKRFIAFTLLNCILTYFIADKVFDNRFDPNVLVKKNLKINEVDCHILNAEYIRIGERDRYGVMPAITITTGDYFAGMNMTDGKGRFQSVWCEKNKMGSKSHLDRVDKDDR